MAEGDRGVKEPVWPKGYVDDMPFVPAYRVTGGTVVFLSGATANPIYHKHPHDPEELRPPKTMREQVRKCLENLKIEVEAAGGTIEDIVKVTIFNRRMDLQDEVNEEYVKFFGRHRPARSHIGVSELVTPDVLIEIEAVAVIDR